MACETAGVGVYSSPAEIMTSTPLAASTSSALANAGADSACVSKPMNNGPVDALLLAILADGLTDGEHVAFVEAHVE